MSKNGEKESIPKKNSRKRHERGESLPIASVIKRAIINANIF